MSRRGKIRLISYFAAVLIVLSAAIAACHVGAGNYITRLDANSARAFGEAFSAAERLRRSIDACAYASDAPMQSALFTQLYADAVAAETALSALPVELDALENLSGQISVVGDYAYLLSRTAANGMVIAEEEISALTGASETVHLFTEALSDIRQSFEQGDLVFEARNRLTDSLDNLSGEMHSSVKTLDDAFHELQSSFPVMEPLAYDGQFNDHSDDVPRMLIGKAIVSPAEAKEAAARFLNCDFSVLKPLDFRGGDLACWRFSMPDRNVVIAVTVRGGEVLQFLSDSVEGEEADTAEAEQIAKDFLTEHGYPEMECVESTAAGSAVMLVFAPQVDNVLCLPDRVSLRVCPASGQVTAFDASDYVRHHTNRVFPEEPHVWTPPESLTVESERKVVLLSPGGRDRYCVEYLCTASDGESVCVDVNAETGLQERILIGNQRAQSID